MIATLKKFLSVSAVSSGEASFAQTIASLLAPHCDKIYTDPLGNLVVYKKSKGEHAKKLLLSTHTDECGIIVNDADANGLLRFCNIGTYPLHAFVYREVRLENGLRGTLLPLGACKTDATCADFAIDIGTKDPKDAKKRVPTGTLGAFPVPYRRLLKNQITAHPLSARVGCALLCHLFQTCESDLYDLYGVFTVQQEAGNRGGAVAAFDLSPDLALIVDSVPSCTACKTGKGVGIKKKDKYFLSDPRYSDFLISLAKEEKIPYQIEIQSESGSDAFAIQRSKGGVMTGALSVPIAHFHTPGETLATSDLENAYRLLQKVITTEFTFI